MRCLLLKGKGTCTKVPNLPSLQQAAKRRKKHDDGGLTILDARLQFVIEEGFAIAFEFATPEVIETWPKMYLPDIPELKQKVADMGSSKIRTNFAFGVPKA